MSFSNTSNSMHRLFRHVLFLGINPAGKKTKTIRKRENIDKQSEKMNKLFTKLEVRVGKMLSSILTVHVRTSVLDCTGLSLDCTGLQSRLGQHFFSHGKCYIYRQRFLIGIVKTFHIYCSFQYIVVYIPPSSSNQFTP